jgi:DNA-binding winged helix-turn-helix (wHTH) protein
MDQGLQHGFRLREVEVHPLSHEVHGALGMSRVSAGAMDFLMCLAESPGDIVETGTLVERLHLESVEQCERRMCELQTALGDSRESPEYVRHVGGGYQLISPISVDVPPEPTTAQIV